MLDLLVVDVHEILGLGRYDKIAGRLRVDEICGLNVIDLSRKAPMIRAWKNMLLH
jgi:O-succinylbenzoate synthase